MTENSFRAVAQIATADASRYLQQLCKHFAHKLPTTFDPTAGRIDFPLGPVTLAATAERLDLAVASDDAARLADLQDVVERHLVRFAFRETLAVAWAAT
ncbi:DUF2218 domain-containing protein [Siculibacillus lacustris]|uniref:DUF2218 domain-containing protein n=1 Tax=Siculibacillus lacustris TaxID=1549641 RepID=A0A4Q9VHM0_9HYPH|nr:DUF2218 domain-containing protein [Siculibacillus lacustris]TBW34639.1 DUF2218 domain-containing protein [Siculibacillus lacustris]